MNIYSHEVNLYQIVAGANFLLHFQHVGQHREDLQWCRLLLYAQFLFALHVAQSQLKGLELVLRQWENCYIKP